MNIKSEKEIEGSNHERPMRERIEKLGDLLVDTTNEVYAKTRGFIQTFNSSFENVQIKKFVFEKSEYNMICQKEIAEIRDIFQ